MEISTKYFEELEIQESDIILFESGIPGFAELKKFIMINQEEATFSYLQSLEDQSICFIIMPPGAVVPDYSIEISESTIKKLNIEKQEDVCIFSLLNIPENIEEMTINLKAPIIINSSNRKAVQEILDNDNYSLRHKIAKEADA